MAIDRDRLLQSATKLIEKKKYDKAIVEYQKIVQHDPKDARTLLKIGDLYSKLKDYGAAVETYDRVATFYASQGFQLKAIAVFKQIREIIRKQAPELAARYSHITPRLADIYAELNLVTDALAAYDEVATNFQKAGRDYDAIHVFEKTVALDPRNPLPHLRLAEARCRVRALDEAIDSFWTAAELLLGLRRPDDALKVIERILHFRPEPIYARAAAELFLQKGDQASGLAALSRLQVAFQANPKDLDTLALLAQAFEVIEQPDKAFEVHLEMTRLCREQRRVELWHQIMAHLRQVAPHSEQVRALDRAGPPLASQMPHSRGPVSVEFTEEEEAIDLDEEVEYLEDAEIAASHRPSQGRIPLSPRISDMPRDIDLPSSTLRASRPPSVTSPSLRGELLDIEEEDDAGVAVGEVRRGEVEERGSRQSFRPSTHAHKAIADANQFQNMGLLDKSVEVLHIALELDPNSIPIREKLREILVIAGEREPAIVETLNIAIIHIHNQNPDEAEPLALEVLEIEPGHPDALNILEHVEALRASQGTTGENGRLSSYDMEGVRPSQAINHMPPAPALPHFEEGPYSAHGFTGPISTRGSGYPRSSGPPPADTFKSPPPSRHPRSRVPGARSLTPGVRPSLEAIEEVLEEAEFFAAQGLYSDAIAILSDMLEHAPDHLLLIERLAEVRDLEEGGDPDPLKLHGGEPQDNAFDIAASLDALDELDEPSTRPALASIDQEVDVDQVFAKFKEGVKAVVEDSDAATHYDLGLAYKEMGLLEDACSEFELASNDPLRSAMCFFMIGSIRRELGQIAQAKEAFIRGLSTSHITGDEQNGIEYELALVLQSEGNQTEYVKRLKRIASRDIGYRDVSARIRALGEAVPDSGNEDDDLDAAFNNLLG